MITGNLGDEDLANLCATFAEFAVMTPMPDPFSVSDFVFQSLLWTVG
jgi:hypothetical protein